MDKDDARNFHLTGFACMTAISVAIKILKNKVMFSFNT
jgi:hypothetical protein